MTYQARLEVEEVVVLENEPARLPVLDHVALLLELARLVRRAPHLGEDLHHHHHRSRRSRQQASERASAAWRRSQQRGGATRTSLDILTLALEWQTEKRARER